MSRGERGEDGKDEGRGKGHATGGRQDDGQPNRSEGGETPRRPGGDGSDSEDLAKGYSSERDAYDSESHGDVPGYAEIVRATVEGLGSDVRLTLAFAEPVPAQMPDSDTFMSVSFQFERDDHEAIDVYADGDAGGWAPGMESREDFPGRFSIEGRQIMFTIPWESLGGARSYRWSASDSWVHSGLIRTSYSFDQVPNFGRARYP